MESKPVILVVDDQVMNIELIEAYLAQQGFNIISASGGAEAIEVLSAHPIDLILLDVMMPGMNGFEVARRIKQDQAYRQLPIILVTALHETEDRIKGIEAGCDDFISKPFDKTELLARVRSLLKVKAYYDLMSRYQTELEADVAQRTEQLAHAFDSIKAAALEIIHRLSAASECNDETTGTHIKRMSRYCAAIARRMGMDEATADMILYASSMHDLGKIGIPDQILLKPAKLDPVEWEIMKQHSAIGAEIISGSDIELIRMGEIIARSHHEKWDGSGYPDGLKGTEIPLCDRITAVADVFDALTSARPYKGAYSVDESFAIIGEGRGSHFDPDVADAFLAIKDEVLAIKNNFSDQPQSFFNPEFQALLAQYYSGKQKI